jgi:hypothetical protein
MDKTQYKMKLKKLGVNSSISSKKNAPIPKKKKELVKIR